jgi:hypothetical protein
MEKCFNVSARQFRRQIQERYEKILSIQHDLTNARLTMENSDSVLVNTETCDAGNSESEISDSGSSDFDNSDSDFDNSDSDSDHSDSDSETRDAEDFESHSQDGNFNVSSVGPSKKSTNYEKYLRVANLDNDDFETDYMNCLSARGYVTKEFIENYAAKIQEPTNVFTVKMAKWFNEFKLSYKAGSEVLKLFKECFELEIPSDIRTVLGTPRYQIGEIPMSHGNYYHFGIQEMLQKFNLDFLFVDEKIVLDFGIDGVPLYDSSRMELWPIIARFVDKKNAPVFLVGAWCGASKPKDSNEFLAPLANEINDLKMNGVLVTRQNLSKKLEIRAFVCDTVARSALKGVYGHGSILGCQNCDLDKVKCINRRTFPTVAGPSRTDATFEQRTHTNHHHLEYKSIGSHVLEECGIKMVSQFVLDTMHLLDLGIGKRVFKAIYRGRCHDGSKMSAEDQVNFNLLMKALSALTPLDFGRVTRTFEDLAQFKATEFRQLLLYTGIVLLKDFVNADVYYHFLMLFCGYRLISHPVKARENAATARILFQKYVKNFPKVYGAHKVSFNVHNLIHLCDYVELYGSVDSFSAYAFENYMQELKAVVRKPQYILQQIYNRFSIISETNDAVNDSGLCDPMKDTEPFPGCNRSFKGYKFDQFELMNNEADSCCQIDNSIFAEIVKFGEDKNGKKLVIVRPYTSVSNFFTSPMVSLELGVAFCENLSTELQSFPVERITLKYFRMPYSTGSVLVPILHWFKK